MDKQTKIIKLENDIAFWQDKLNRSRSVEIISISAVHLNHARNELAKLQAS
tara:strand:+ start:238 stop:390 length:153 start_codon:yes stop_codon:yes gene_type:complete